MPIKAIPLIRLGTDLEKTLTDCANSGEAVVVEMPDHRLLTIQPFKPDDDDSLVDDLLANSSEFQAVVTKSKSSLRKPFILSD